METPKHQPWKRWVGLLMLAIWIGIDGLVAITIAQVEPPRRKRRMMISTKPEVDNGSMAIDIGESLLKVAQRASRQSKELMADLVFVIDGNESMQTPIASIEKRLVDMVDIFEKAAIDYRLGLIGFQKNSRTPNITVNPLQGDLVALQEGIRSLRRQQLGEPGYGLDAVIQGLRELDFRSEASKNIVLVTNRRLQTAWEADDARSQLVRDIIEQCKWDEIHINIIGINESAQIQLTDETGGKWYAIDENQQRLIDETPMIDKSVLKVDGIFRRIAQHIAATVESATDIVFVFDSSLSMDNKVEEICDGIDTMVRILDSEGVSYRFGVIRFWASAGGGESTVVITKPPLDAGQAKNLFRISKRADEHLLDAIMEGVPKLKTPDDRQLVLCIITDESTSRRQEKGYTASGAIAVCQEARAQVNVIGGITPISSGSFSDAFQQRVTEVTKGLHYIMPGSTIADERR